MSNQTRHEQLITAGWRYDASSDRYAAPGSATDGTQRTYDIGAAWLAFSTDTAPMPPKADAPARALPPDPRHKEPE